MHLTDRGRRSALPLGELHILLLWSSVILAQESGLALTAYWPFDDGYDSVVNNELYKGTPVGGVFTSITNEDGNYARGNGALQLDSRPQSGDGTYVDIANELFPDGHEAVSIACWYRYLDISGDGSDFINAVWETTPRAALSFGLYSDDGVDTRSPEGKEHSRRSARGRHHRR